MVVSLVFVRTKTWNGVCAGVAKIQQPAAVSMPRTWKIALSPERRRVSSGGGYSNPSITGLARLLLGAAMLVDTR